jgi:hypothetical protein
MTASSTARIRGTLRPASSHTATTPAPYVDTNGEWGLSHSNGTFRVSPDGLTLTIAEGTESTIATTSRRGHGVGDHAARRRLVERERARLRFGLDYKDGTLLVEVYSYVAGGASQWYLGAGPLTNNAFTATLDKYVNGQCVSCAYKAPASPATTARSRSRSPRRRPPPPTCRVDDTYRSSATFTPHRWRAPSYPSGRLVEQERAGLGLRARLRERHAPRRGVFVPGGRRVAVVSGGRPGENNHVFTATLDKYTSGQCVSCAYKAPSVSGNDGTITITFTSATTATADLPGGRHIQIERFFP